MPLNVFRSVALAACMALGVGHADARSPRQGACFTTLPPQRFNGTLAAGAADILREWRAECTGLFVASVVPGQLVLQRWDTDHWTDVGRGQYVQVPKLAPARYRLRVENPTPARISYSGELRVSAG